MRARVSHAGNAEAGAPLSRRFNEHLGSILQSDARNPEVQNRHGALRREGLAGPNVSFSGNEANPLFHNTGKGFVEVGTTMGISRREDGRGFVLTDLDGDGALDVVLHNHFRNPLVALLNRAASGNRWMRIRLRGTKSNRFGIGARVTVNGRVRELACGTGYLSGNAPELHFGLGAAERADVQVRWPSGRVDAYPGLEAGRIHTLVEGDPAARKSEGLRGQSVALPAPPAAEEREPDLAALVKELDPEARVVIFFSVDCIACKSELLRGEELERRAREKGVKLLWVSTDADFARVEKEFRENRSAILPRKPPADLPPVAVPAVYVAGPAGFEKFSGRHAVTAALEAVTK